MGKILLTRPQRLSRKIANNLAKKNLPSLIQPLFSIVLIDNIGPIEQKPQAVLITSSAAVFALEKLLIKKDVLILAVGDKTADIISKLGYQNILIARGSADSLLNLALDKLSKSSGLVLYLSGEVIALNLADKLQESNFSAQKIVVYRTVWNKKFASKTIKEIKLGSISEVWIYSKNSLRNFYKLAEQHNLLEYFNEIKILCLTQEIANLADGMGFLKTGIIKE